MGWIDALRLNGHIPSYIDYGQLAHHGTRAALPTLEKMLLSESLHWSGGCSAAHKSSSWWACPRMLC